MSNNHFISIFHPFFINFYVSFSECRLEIDKIKRNIPSVMTISKEEKAAFLQNCPFDRLDNKSMNALYDMFCKVFGEASPTKYAVDFNDLEHLLIEVAEKNRLKNVYCPDYKRRLFTLGDRSWRTDGRQGWHEEAFMSAGLVWAVLKSIEMEMIKRIGRGMTNYRF